jgi:haloalkane dehalogenase
MGRAEQARRDRRTSAPDPKPDAGPRRPAWVAPALFPFQSRFVEVGGCRLHYVDEGEGPILLLLHGNPTWSFLYRDVIKGLSGSFRCVAPDYPGFGLSEAPSGYGFTPAEHAQVVEGFVRTLDLRDVTLVAQDWGGPIGLGIAARCPERFGGLVLLSTFAWPVNGTLHFEAFSRLMGGPLGGFLIRNFNAFVNLVLPAGVRRRRLAPEVMAAYRGPFSRRAARTPTHVFPREILRSRAYLAEVERGLALLKHLPTLIVWGDRDLYFRPAERRRFERLLPNHRTVLVREAGHYLQEDAPEELVSAIAGWLGRRGVPAAAPGGSSGGSQESEGERRREWG